EPVQAFRVCLAVAVGEFLEEAGNGLQVLTPLRTVCHHPLQVGTWCFARCTRKALLRQNGAEAQVKLCRLRAARVGGYAKVQPDYYRREHHPDTEDEQQGSLA